MPGALHENPAAVEEHSRAEHQRNPTRAREGGRSESDGVRNHLSPDHRRDRQEERDPELLSEHRHRVTGVFVMAVGVLVSVTATVRGTAIAPLLVVMHGALIVRGAMVVLMRHRLRMARMILVLRVAVATHCRARWR